MTQSFKKVSAGQPYSGFPAALYNAIVDVVNAYRGGQLTFRPAGFDTVRSTGLVQIKNATGSDLARLSVVGLDEPIFTPTEDAEEFRNRVRFDGVSPTDDHSPDKFAVLLRPLKTNEVGLATVAGVTPAKVYVQDELHEYATAQQSTTQYLVSSPDRGARILWKPEGASGATDCIVRMPCPPQVAVIEIANGTCDEPELYGGTSVWDATILEADVTGSDLSDPWQDIPSPDAYAVATNECEDLTKMKLRGGERFLAIRLGQWDAGSGPRPLYAIMAPHGKVRVNEDDALDYLEDQYVDHESSATYAEGDVVVKSETQDESGDKKIKRFIDVAGYDGDKQQALTHPDSGDTPTWVEVVEVEVVTDLRIYNASIEKRTSTIKVLGNTDNGWSEALPATECD